MAIQKENYSDNPLRRLLCLENTHHRFFPFNHFLTRRQRFLSTVRFCDLLRKRFYNKIYQILLVWAQLETVLRNTVWLMICVALITQASNEPLAPRICTLKAIWLILWRDKIRYGNNFISTLVYLFVCVFIIYASKPHQTIWKIIHFITKKSYHDLAGSYLLHWLMHRQKIRNLRINYVNIHLA